MSTVSNPLKNMAEKEEESKLKAKYPAIQQRPGPAFLQKRLQKGQKFFDSGDYNMAKAAAAKGGSAGKSRLASDAAPPLPPTTLSASPVSAIIPGQLPSPTGAGGPILPPPLSPGGTTGDAIPTPDFLATRKASIHVPSKLVSGGP